MLKLPIHPLTRFVVVSPHYPENVGACARALKTMGFTRLGLVSPGSIAQPDHEMAVKMAVRSLDVLAETQLFDNLDEAIVGAGLVVATTARRGVSGVLSPREVAQRALDHAARGQQICFLFGNEKTGLSKDDHSRAELMLRIPMAADQPSINLAQSVQIVAYELFCAALERRGHVA
ncbi:MAG TPA: RNA methyltransferase [Polyangiaceae bacterium]